MSAGPSRGDQPEDNPGAMRLVIDLDLDLLPNDPGEELRRILGFWTAWLPKMDLTQPVEHALTDSNYHAVGSLRLLDANATSAPEVSEPPE